LERECLDLGKQVKSLESQLKALSTDNKRLEKSAQEMNEIALKKISRLVDKIDQCQAEMKFS
jgi:predicted RNase H-like nuclease (RuvC/YqgF family)